MISRIMHVNIVVSDVERAIAFYRDVLGAKVIKGVRIDSQGDQEIGEALGFGGAASWSHYMLRFGDDRNATWINLLQWHSPPSTGKPHERLNNVGIARIAFAVEDVDQAYLSLRAKGVEFISPPAYVDVGPLGAARVCLFRHPDGTFLELAQPVPKRT